MLGVTLSPKLRVLLYDVLLPTTAITAYAIGFRKLSANGEFFNC